MSANVEVIDVSSRMVGPWKIDTATTETDRDNFGFNYPSGKTLTDKVQITPKVAADLVVNV